MTQQIYSAICCAASSGCPIAVPVLVGIMLCRATAAGFIHNELAGVFVPEDVRERMRLAGENGIAEGIAHARELLEE
jgi:homocysteine S-methyltransferase